MQKNVSNVRERGNYTYTSLFRFLSRITYKQDIYHSRFKLEASIRRGIAIGVLKKQGKISR